MGIIYRTTGPWGVGKGANLSNVEGDENLYDHELRIVDLETTRPQPDNFASITIAGTRITFTTALGHEFPPLDLPVLKWRWRGEWAGSTGYAANDTFSRAGVGIFAVNLDHLSASVFDKDAVVAGDTIMAGAFTVAVAYTIASVGSTDFTLIGASANTVGISFTATGVGSGTGTATINGDPLYSELFALGVDLFATGVGAFLADPSSANLAAAVTDETSGGVLVFSDYVDAAVAAALATAGVTASPTEINQYTLCLDIADGSAEAVYYLVCPHAGDVKAIQTVVDGAVSTADITITAKIGATAITDGVVTIATSGSAAGDLDSATPSAANTVTAGQAVNFTVTGGGAGGSPRIHLAMVIER